MDAKTITKTMTMEHVLHLEALAEIGATLIVAINNEHYGEDFQKEEARLLQMAGLSGYDESRRIVANITFVEETGVELGDAIEAARDQIKNKVNKSRPGRQPLATEQEIRDQVRAAREAGESVTLRAVREAVGGGSMTRIAKIVGDEIGKMEDDSVRG